ncbi:MAG: tRNA 2-thiouridine(34) synthase MnmA [bacterium]
MTTVGIGMSGGLDSAVAAHRLIHKTDVDVFGFTMRIGDLEAQHDRTCCSMEDLMDAKKMCDEYGIPHYTIDVESLFKESVVEPFVDGYLKGQTPNPCVWCNRTVKFGYLVEKIRKLGGDYLAMGHYVQGYQGPDGPRIYRGADDEKDQSYYMAFVNPDYLDYVWFPIGHFEKDEVREYAQRHDILVADKQESQSICFVPDMDYKKFIREYTGEEPEPGDIKNIDGETIGEHSGIQNYTIGQRRGLGISHHEPLFVLKINAEDNELIVGERDRLEQTEFTVGPVNWLSGDRNSCDVQIRYNGESHSCYVEQTGEEEYTVTLDQPEQGIAEGQIAVFYDGDQLLGGAVITGAPLPFEANPDLKARIQPRTGAGV